MVAQRKKHRPRAEIWIHSNRRDAAKGHTVKGGFGISGM